jgi:ABC-type multidrug transport system fused ATPase/permease subunit
VWRTTGPFLWQTIKARRRDLVLVVIGGFVAGTIATLKSYIESVVIQSVADAISNGHPNDAWSTHLQPISTSDGDWVLGVANLVTQPLTLSAGLVVYVVSSVLAALFTLMTTAARQNMTRHMFTSLFASGLNAAFSKGSPEQPQDEPGGLAGAIQQGAKSVSDDYGLLIEGTQYLVVIGTIVVTLSSVSINFALLCTGVTLVLATLSWLQGIHLNKRREKYDDQRKKLFGSTDDVLINRDVLLAHERKAKYVDHLAVESRALATIDKQLSIREQAYNGTVSVVQEIGTIAILGVVLIAASQGVPVDRVGQAYFYVAIFGRLMEPIRGLLSGYDSVRSSLSTSRTLVSLLTPRSAADVAVTPALPPASSAARLHRVCFTYPSGRQVLSDCSFDVPSGGVTLIVGRSGSGKTTIARLLLGFLNAEAGTVEVLSRPVEAWDHEDMLARMSYLAQTGHVVDGSVGENLFAAVGVSHDELVQVILQVGLAENPAQAAQVLDQEAHELSEGQKQRLALARILVDRSPIAVLDEPLAGVDAFTFQEVRPHLTTWMNDPTRTVVLISHRLAFASLATHVVMVGTHGQVLEEGDPGDLLDRPDGTFRRLVLAARQELGQP